MYFTLLYMTIHDYIIFLVLYYSVLHVGGYLFVIGGEVVVNGNIGNTSQPLFNVEKYDVLSDTWVFEQSIPGM